MKKTIFFTLFAVLLLSGTGCTDSDLYSSEENSPTAGIDDTELVLDGKAESGRISIRSNIWWKARLEYDGGEEWLSLSPESGFGNIEIEVATDRNKTDVFDCGGIAAYNFGRVENCVNDAPIVAMNQVGGIVAMNGGTVTGCVNNGDITANYYFGTWQQGSGAYPYPVLR